MFVTNLLSLHEGILVIGYLNSTVIFGRKAYLDLGKVYASYYYFCRWDKAFSRKSKILLLLGSNIQELFELS